MYIHLNDPGTYFGEPIALVALELLLWIGVALSEEMVIAKIYGGQ